MLLRSPQPARSDHCKLTEKEKEDTLSIEKAIPETNPQTIHTATVQERINEILPMLDEMVTEGLVTLEAVEIIAYRSSKQP